MGLFELYKEVGSLGDLLTGISDRIDFEYIRPMLTDLCEDDTEKSGRPNYEPILTMKILLLGQCYKLSDRKGDPNSDILHENSRVSREVTR